MFWNHDGKFVFIICNHFTSKRGLWWHYGMLDISFTFSECFSCTRLDILKPDTCSCKSRSLSEKTFHSRHFDLSLQEKHVGVKVTLFMPVSQHAQYQRAQMHQNGTHLFMLLAHLCFSCNKSMSQPFILWTGNNSGFFVCTAIKAKIRVYMGGINRIKLFTKYTQRIA